MITATRHVLPFDALSPEDFERLCFFLVRKLGYTDVEHLGAAGADGGRDVIGRHLVDGVSELVSFQCKRARSGLNVSRAVSDVHKVAASVHDGSGAKPDRLCFVSSDAISANARKAIRAACDQEGFDVSFLARTELDYEVKQFPELLAEFFNLAAQSAPSVPPPPCTLPPASRRFINRKADLQELDRIADEALAAGLSGIAVVRGAPGIGKSALCLQWAGTHQERFPHGQLFIDFERWRNGTTVPMSDIMAHVLSELGIDSAAIPADYNERVDLYQRTTRGRRLLIIADDVDTAAQATVLRPTGAGSLLLVATRLHLPLLLTLGGQPVDVGRFGSSAARKLVTTVAGRARVHDEPDAVAELVALCDGLPLLLATCAATIAGRAPGSAARLLTTARYSPDSPSLQLARTTTATLTLDAAYATLAPELASTYRLVVGSPLPDLTVDAATALLATPAPDAARRCADLAAASLADPTSARQWRSHILLREHARSITESEPGERKAAMRRAAVWYAIATSCAERATVQDRPRLGLMERLLPRTGALPRFDDTRSAFTWWNAERLNVMACAEHAAQQGWHDEVMLFGEAVWPLAVALKHFSAWEKSQRLAADSAVRTGDRRAEARFRSQLARALAETGRPDEARREAQAAVDAATASGDPVMVASTIEFAGTCALESGEFEKALRAYDLAAPQFEAIGIPRGVALQHYYASRALLGLGRPQDALDRIAAAFDTLVLAGDEISVARALLRQGEAHIALGTPDKAVEALMSALEAATASGSQFEQAEAYELLAQTAVLRGNPASANAYRSNAVDLYGQLGHPRAQAIG